jgi:hypothetical protein
MKTPKLADGTFYEVELLDGIPVIWKNHHGWHLSEVKDVKEERRHLLKDIGQYLTEEQARRRYAARFLSWAARVPKPEFNP